MDDAKIKSTLSEEWRDIKYQETFDEEIRGLHRRLQTDSEGNLCPAGSVEVSAGKIEEFEGILQNLYILDGADQGGRGCLQDVIMAARIAAFEHFLAQLKLNKK
ncbi:MAG: hypothetical protein FWB86_00195 [Treponema sp.]|nr:hypothetical protein [Treponema sp.]MCL2251360.1 hypothetical protein [Treponema sp.]